MNGAVSITGMVLIPFRSQAALGSTPLQAGVRLLPFSLSIPIGFIIQATITRRFHSPPLYTALVGQIFQVIGLVVLSKGSTQDPGWSGIYGIEVIVGLGIGFAISAVTLLTPLVAGKKNLGKFYHT
jgi:hypothetical protein